MSELTLAGVLRDHGLADREAEAAVALDAWLDAMAPQPPTAVLSDAEADVLTRSSGVRSAGSTSAGAESVVMNAGLARAVSSLGSWDTAELAHELGIETGSVRRRLSGGGLYSLDVTRGRRRLYPRWQVHQGAVLPHLPEVLAALPDDLDPVEVEQFFIAEDTSALDEVVQSPRPSVRDWLVSGRSPGPVVAAARRLAQRGY